MVSKQTPHDPYKTMPDTLSGNSYNPVTFVAYETGPSNTNHNPHTNANPPTHVNQPTEPIPTPIHLQQQLDQLTQTMRTILCRLNTIEERSITGDVGVF